MKKLLQLCFAATLAFGAQAYGAPILDNSKTLDVSQTLAAAGSYDFFRTVNTASAALGQGNNFFSDKYTFSVGAASQANGELTSVLFRNHTGLVIESFTLQSADGKFLATGELFDKTDQSWIFDGTALSAGNYIMAVNGYATATSASYSGTLTVSAVPEPASLALMLGGLAVLGVATRRRS